MASPYRFAYLAGLIDGEGSIHILTRPYVAKATGERRLYYLLEVNVYNTHYGLMEWLRKHFGGTIARASETGPADVQWKPSYRWIVSAKKAAALLRAVQKYLVVKRERAAVALAFDRCKIAPGGSDTRQRPPEYFAKQERYYQELRALNRRGLPVTTNTPTSA